MGNNPSQVIPYEEVCKHSSRESAWLVAGREVYDVTSFLDEHPAGANAILRKAGGYDCTYDMKMHSSGAQKIWQSFLIGRLPKSDLALVANRAPPPPSVPTTNVVVSVETTTTLIPTRPSSFAPAAVYVDRLDDWSSPTTAFAADHTFPVPPVIDGIPVGAPLRGATLDLYEGLADEDDVPPYPPYPTPCGHPPQAAHAPPCRMAAVCAAASTCARAWGAPGTPVSIECPPGSTAQPPRGDPHPLTPHPPTFLARRRPQAAVTAGRLRRTRSASLDFERDIRPSRPACWRPQCPFASAAAHSGAVAAAHARAHALGAGATIDIASSHPLLTSAPSDCAPRCGRDRFLRAHVGVAVAPLTCPPPDCGLRVRSVASQAPSPQLRPGGALASTQPAPSVAAPGGASGALPGPPMTTPTVPLPLRPALSWTRTASTATLASASSRAPSTAGPWAGPAGARVGTTPPAVGALVSEARAGPPRALPPSSPPSRTTSSSSVASPMLPRGAASSGSAIVVRLRVQSGTPVGPPVGPGFAAAQHTPRASRVGIPAGPPAPSAQVAGASSPAGAAAALAAVAVAGAAGASPAAPRESAGASETPPVAASASASGADGTALILPPPCGDAQGEPVTVASDTPPRDESQPRPLTSSDAPQTVGQPQPDDAAPELTSATSGATGASGSSSPTNDVGPDALQGSRSAPGRGGRGGRGANRKSRK